MVHIDLGHGTVLEVVTSLKMVGEVGEVAKIRASCAFRFYIILYLLFCYYNFTTPEYPLHFFGQIYAENMLCSSMFKGLRFQAYSKSMNVLVHVYVYDEFI